MRMHLDPWPCSVGQGQGSSIAASCGVGCRWNLDPMLLWLWCRPATVALIRPLAWESPYATSAPPPKKREILTINPVAPWNPRDMCFQDPCAYSDPLMLKSPVLNVLVPCLSSYPWVGISGSNQPLIQFKLNPQILSLRIGRASSIQCLWYICILDLREILFPLMVSGRGSGRGLNLKNVNCQPGSRASSGFFLLVNHWLTHCISFTFPRHLVFFYHPCKFYFSHWHTPQKCGAKKKKRLCGKRIWKQ